MSFTALLAGSGCGGSKDKDEDDPSDGGSTYFTDGGGAGEKQIQFTTGTWTDPRDNNTYKIISYSMKEDRSFTITAENMRYTGTPKSPLAYLSADGDSDNDAIYGLLYDIETAAQHVCPAGWHLPTKKEMEDFIDYIRNNMTGDSIFDALAARDYGWICYTNKSVNEAGFGALPAGYGDPIYSVPQGFGHSANFWTSSEDGTKYSSYSLTDGMSNKCSETIQPRFDWGAGTSDLSFSVRCVKDGSNDAEGADAGLDEKDASTTETDAGTERPDAGPVVCADGLHDGGDGTCVSEGMCSKNYHLDADSGECLADRCPPNYEEGEPLEDGAPNCLGPMIGFISIPAGSFVLSHDTGTYLSNAEVSLDAFLLGKTPVTVEEFNKCVAAGRCNPKNYKTFDAENDDEEFCNYGREDTFKDNHPMNCVALEGAKEFCKWVGGRLPNEEEWEYAATHDGKAHLDTPYAFGNTLDHCVNAQYYDTKNGYCMGNERDNIEAAQGTSSVYLHSPAGDNPLGLLDMTGNVNEWCVRSGRFARKGGAWSTEADKLSVTHRFGGSGDLKANHTGFRCAKNKFF